MRLIADSGLWSCGPGVAVTPLAAVVELSGAVLSWTIDDARGAAATQITLTDLARADWLWRLLGESGHVALASALERRAAEDPQIIELTEVDILPGSIDPLRRLAVGHWLRRWWPASRRDGIVGLDRALLDVELALLTADSQEFFTFDTLDSDVAELLSPHAAALLGHVQRADPRVLQLVRAAVELVDEVGLDDIGWSEVSDALDNSIAPGELTRDDYALAAGSEASPRAAAAIASGVSSVNWSAVPPRIFDAAENTIDWRIEVIDQLPAAVVHAATIGPGPATGIAVDLHCGTVGGAGVLDADGRATLPLVDAARRPMTESAAWDHDWSTMSVVVGAGVAESREVRERIRRWASARLDQLASDAFLAEILAAESAY